jgi:hypothetical protein
MRKRKAIIDLDDFAYRELTRSIPPLDYHVSLPSTVHVVLVELARAVAGLRKVGHDTIHTDAVLVSRVTRHVRPIPLERHWHLPEVLWYVVEGLIKLTHGHGIHVVDTIDFDAGGVGESALLLEHLRGHRRRSKLTHLSISLQGCMREVGRERERLLLSANTTFVQGCCTYFIEALKVRVEDHAGRCMVLRCGR